MKLHFESAYQLSRLQILIGALILFGGSQGSFAAGENPKALRKQIDQLYQAGRYREAIPITQELLDAIQKRHRREKHDTAVALSLLGAQYLALGDYNEAKQLLQRALEIDLRVLGAMKVDLGLDYYKL